MTIDTYLDELDFHEIMALLYATWRTESHCMRFGCGRETLAHWVEHATGVWLPAWAYRRALLWCVGLGIARHSKNEQTNYSCFEFADNACPGGYRLIDTMAVNGKIHQMYWGFFDRSQRLAVLSGIPVGENVVPMCLEVSASLNEIFIPTDAMELHFRRHDVYRHVWQRVQ
jgi:hypothetical protein